MAKRENAFEHPLNLLRINFIEPVEEQPDCSCLFGLRSEVVGQAGRAFPVATAQFGFRKLKGISLFQRPAMNRYIDG